MRSSPLIQKFLATKLSEYLLACMRQNRDNTWLRESRESNPQARTPFPHSYFSWARSTGADYISCPFAFQFFIYMIAQSNAVRSTFESAQAQYLSSSISRILRRCVGSTTTIALYRETQQRTTSTAWTFRNSMQIPGTQKKLPGRSPPMLKVHHAVLLFVQQDKIL